MRFIPGYSASAVETIPAPRVAWRSQTWDVVSVRLDRTIGGPMVHGWADMIQATAEVVMWSPDAGIESDTLNLPSPDRVMPRKGEYVDVYLGDDRGELRCLRGRIMDVSVPSALSPELSVTLGDFVSRFDYATSMGALGYRHPTSEMGAEDVRYSLHTVGVVARLFRDAGFHAVPEQHPDALAFVPLVGDAVPVRGNLVSSGLTNPGPEQVSPLPFPAPWGLAVMHLSHRYSFRDYQGTFYVSGLMNVPESPPGRAAVRLSSDKGDLVVWLGRSAITVEHVGGGTVGAVYTADQAEQELHWAVWVGGNGGIIVQVGNSTQETLGTIPALAGATWTHLSVQTPARGGVQLAGIQMVPVAGTISNRWYVPRGFERTAVIRSSGANGTMLGRPSIVQRNALDLLKEIAQAERAAVWVDEDGRAHWRARSRLFNAAYTSVSANDVQDLSWHGMWQASRDRVEVKWRRPTLKLSPWAHFTLWESAPVLGIGDLFEEFIGPDADTDWLHVDGAVPILSFAAGTNGEQSRRNARNRRRSMWTGIVRKMDAPDGDNLADFPAFSSTGTAWVEQIAPDRWLVHADAYYKSAGNFGLEANQELHMRVPSLEDFAVGSNDRSAVSKLDPSLYGEDGLVIRGKGLQSWHDESTVVGTGTTDGAAEHDAGVWVQTTKDATDLGGFLHGFYTEDRPVYESVPVAPDVRRQVGDIIRLEVGPIQVRALILSIHDEASAGRWEQSLTLQTIGAITDA